MFTREALLASDWYTERLHVKQERDIALWTRHLAALEASATSAALLAQAREQMSRVSAAAYLAELVGTIGADPFTAQ